MAVTIHPTALVHPNAKFGVNVSIGPFTIVEDNVEIGDNSTIFSHALIADGARIGASCRIFQGASISQIPQDLKFGGEKTLTRIGDNTTIREYVTLNKGTVAHGETSIGSDCLIMAYGHVGHDSIIGNNVIISNALGMAGHVVVGNNVTISGITAIHQFCRIGDHAMVSAHCYINQDIVPYAVCADNPLRIVSINKIGLERRGFSEERRRNIKRAYKTIFRSGLTLAMAIAELEQSYPADPDIEVLVKFIRADSRGLVRMSENEPE